MGAGGKGSVVSTLFSLREGSLLKLAVAQLGISRGSKMTVGGAGGSFVVESDPVIGDDVIGDADQTELMLAAGVRKLNFVLFIFRIL